MLLKHCEKLKYGSNILNLDTRWKWSASRPSHFTPGDRSHDIHWMGVWVMPQIRSGRCGKEKNYVTLPGIELWSSYPVAYSQYQLSYQI
jgi:hypothetical protein